MEMAEKLAEERRARLAAERLLELKQAELVTANKKLGQHARQLSHEITETRAEVAEVRDENRRVVSQLGEATQKIELVEDQLWKALQTIRDGFAMFDSQNRLEIANPAYMSVFDGLAGVNTGTSYAEILKYLVEEGIVDLQGEGGKAWQERMYARWDYDPIPHETVRLWNGRFVKIQDRRTPEGGVVSLCGDITNLARMWSAVDQLPDGFVLYDSDDKLLMCNGPYKDFYSASAPSMQPGASFEDILRYGLERGQYSAAVGREEDWLEERLERHLQADQELEQQLSDGRWLRVYERKLRDGGRVGLRVDITHIKENQQRLKDAMTRAEGANRAKSAFLANMSHEIRTPMNGVVGMADLMMETELTDDQRLYLDTIRSSGEALLVIINDILDYSKIEAEKLEIHPEPFDLERAIHEVVMLLQPTARDKDITLLVDYDMFLPTRFVGDPGRVRQILTNLLGNAVKFTIEGHVLVRVVGMIADEGPSAIHVTIEDTGIGIPADKVNHVFGEFNQVEDERNRNFEGTGLGLAISRRLVELMDGEVWVESELGKGSCFGFRILMPTDEPCTYERAAIPTHLKRVMVVDDHNANNNILSKQLDILGLKSVFCKTGTEAIDRMDERPDILIVEQDLPDMLGQELVAHFRSKGWDIPAILLSNNPGALDPMEGGEVQTVLQKPAPRRLLFQALENAQPVTLPDVAVLPAPEPAAPSQPTPAPAVEPAPPVPDDETTTETSDTPAEEPTTDAPAPQQASPHIAPPSIDPDTPLDVLVAEDNKTNQLVFKKMASGFNVNLRFANNGIEAVEAYRAQKPELIFMDISMPQMDGKQATREIRAIEGDGPNVTIIAVTAHAMSGDREAILEAGLDDYLTKPLRKAALSEKIEEARTILRAPPADQASA
ncbi:MAG: PAS-domain containing protein [Pelagimonas sp.]|jgi:signal transduction histidine kinase/DNA-binding response OmpR family regulator|nr:PAS-domain containing protein [Pelagimonas sp.]